MITDRIFRETSVLDERWIASDRDPTHTSTRHICSIFIGWHELFTTESAIFNFHCSDFPPSSLHLSVGRYKRGTECSWDGFVLVGNKGLHGGTDSVLIMSDPKIITRIGRG